MPKIHPDGTPKPAKLASPQAEPQAEAQTVEQPNADQPETELAITRVVEEQTPESST